MFAYFGWVLLFRTIILFKKCRSYTWRNVTSNNFTENNALPKVFLHLLIKLMIPNCKYTIYYFSCQVVKGHFTSRTRFMSNSISLSQDTNNRCENNRTQKLPRI